MTALALLLVALALTGPAHAEACRRTESEASRAGPAAPCPPGRRVEPYDPDAVRAGRRPGTIDFGNGTEVRIGGRVRMDYDVRR